MDTLEFVKLQREIDSAANAGDFPRAFELADEISSSGELSAVQQKLLKRSVDLINRKSGRNGQISEPVVTDTRVMVDEPAPERSGSRQMTPQSLLSRQEPAQAPRESYQSQARYPAAPMESEAIRALESLESRGGSQVSGLLRQLPQSDLADQIAKHIVDLRHENNDLTIRLSQRMTAVEPAQAPKMEVKTLGENESIGAPKGARTRLFEKKHMMEDEEAKAPSKQSSQMISAVIPPSEHMAASPNAEDADEPTREQQFPPAKLSPASLRRSPTLAPPPEHLDPTPPPPSWLVSRDFKKLLILVPIILLIGLMWLGYSLFSGGSGEITNEVRLETSPPSIAGLKLGDSFEDAREALREKVGETPPSGEDPRTAYHQSSSGIRILPYGDRDAIREIRVSATGNPWSFYYKAGSPPMGIGVALTLKEAEEALTGAYFDKVDGGEDATSLTFRRIADSAVMLVKYRLKDDVNAGRIESVTLTAKE